MADGITYTSMAGDNPVIDLLHFQVFHVYWKQQIDHHYGKCVSHRYMGKYHIKTSISFFKAKLW